MPSCLKFPFILFIISLLAAATGKAQPLTAVWPKAGLQVDTTTQVLRWNSHPAAQQYRIEIGYTPSLSPTILSQQTGADSLPVVLPLSDTVYYWRVTADTGQGFNLAGPTYTFRVFHPTDLPGLALWLDAGRGVTIDGSNRVSHWTNLADTFDAEQPTLTRQPALVASVPQLAGRPTVRFNGTSNWLDLGNNLDIGNGAISIAYVGIINNSNIWRVIQKRGTGTSGSTPGWQFAGSGQNYGFSVMDNGSGGIIQVPTTSQPLSTYHLGYTTFNVPNQELKVFRNHSFIQSGTLTGNMATSNILNNRNATIGCAWNAVGTQSQYLNGDLSELILSKSPLTDSIRTFLEEYIHQKFSPSINLGYDYLIPYGFCSVNINAPNHYLSYQWSNGVSTQSINVISTGMYSLTVSDIFGRIISDTILVSYAIQPETIPDTFLCSGEQIIWVPISGNNGSYSYLWSTGATTDSLTITAAGTYRVTITDTFNCTWVSPEVTVMVDPFPVTASLGPDTSLCEGNRIGLQSGTEPGIQYLWSTSATTETIPVFTSGAYMITATNTNGCVATDTLTVTITGIAPQADFSFDTVCLGIASTFTDLSDPPPGATLTAWQWDFGHGTSTLQHPVFTFPDTSLQQVTLTVTASNNCKAIHSKTLRVRPLPVADFTTLPVGEGCTGVPVSFFDQSSVPPPDQVALWQWDFGDGNTANIQDPTHTYSSPGSRNIVLEVESAFGCLAVASHTFEVASSAVLPTYVGLVYPADGAVVTSDPASLRWDKGQDVNTYDVVLARDPLFLDTVAVIRDLLLPETTVGGLAALERYFWKVVAFNACRQSIETQARSFYTLYIGSLDSLALWLKGDAGIVKNGNNVAQWLDQGPKQIHAIQPTANAQPAVVDALALLNNHTAIRFNGNNHWLDLGDNLDLNDGHFVIIYLARINNLATTWRLLQKRGSGSLGSTEGWQFTGAGLDIANTLFDNGQGIFVRSNPTPINNLDYHFGSIIMSVPNESIDFYKNGILTVQSFTQGNIAGSHITTTRHATIGCAWDSPTSQSQYLNGDIAEIIVIQDTVSTFMREAIEAYLRHKYAPPVNLGPDIYLEYGFCDTTLRAGTHFTSYQWNTGATTPALTTNRPGTYSVTVTDVFGFTSVDTVRIWHPVHLVPDTTLCLGDTLTWDTRLDPGQYSILWPDNSTGAAYTTATHGPLWLTITDQNNCTFTDTIFLTIDSFEVTTTLGPDRVLCTGNTLMLHTNAERAEAYLWSTGSIKDFAEVTGPGNYWVEVSSTTGCTARDTVNIGIQGTVPTVDFDAFGLCRQAMATFTDRSTPATGDVLTAWEWNFGGATPLFGDTVSHTFPDSGTYTVRLTVSTANGCVHALERPLFVHPPPVPAFTVSNPCHGVPLAFTDQTAVYNGSATAWLWDFGDGGSSTLQHPQHTYSAPGSYPVVLRATSQYGCTDTLLQLVSVKGSPVAAFGYVPACSEQLTAFRDSSDPALSGPITQWLWDFGDQTSSTVRNPEHLYLLPGTYDVVLRVTAANGCATDTLRPVTVHRKPDIAFGPDSVCRGLPFTFDNQSNPYGSGAAQWLWAFGDGSTDTARYPQHSYANTGSYPVRLRVVNDAGCRDSLTQNVQVFPLPEADFSFQPDFGAAPIDIRLVNSSQGAATYEWQVTDSFGNTVYTGSDASPLVHFADNGRYTVRLISSTGAGCRDTFFRELFIAVPVLDLWVEQVFVAQEVRTDGTVRVDMAARVRNLGSRTVSGFDLVASVAGSGTLSERWEGTLHPGGVVDYTFSASFYLSDLSRQTFLCIEARNLNNNEPDDRPDDNTRCALLKPEMQVRPPYPNPARNSITFDIALPTPDLLVVELYNSIGQHMLTVHNGTGATGLNRFTVPLTTLSGGTYYLRTTWREETRMEKFVIQ